MTLSVCVAFFVDRMGDFSSDASQGGRRRPGMAAMTLRQSLARFHSPSKRLRACCAASLSASVSDPVSPQTLFKEVDASSVRREPRGTRKWAQRRAGASASASASASRRTSKRSGAGSPARRLDLRSPSRGSQSRGRLGRGAAAGRLSWGTTAPRPPPRPSDRMNASFRAMRSSRSISYWDLGGGT